MTMFRWRIYTGPIGVKQVAAELRRHCSLVIEGTEHVTFDGPWKDQYDLLDVLGRYDVLRPFLKSDRLLGEPKCLGERKTPRCDVRK